jgi:dephospho-CoA kinase
MVFSDEAALQDLNTITHEAVRQEVLRRLEEKPDLAAIDAIALFESGLDVLCDVTVAVTAPLEERVQRLTARDNIPESYARQRIAAQHDDDWFRSRCDYILENNETKKHYYDKCLAFLKELGIM